MLEITIENLSNEELMRLQDVIDRILNTRRCDTARVQSPSKVYMKIGAQMAEGTLHKIEVLSTDEGGDLHAGN